MAPLLRAMYNKNANRVLCNAVHRLYYGFMYFHNVIQFRGTGVKISSFMLTRKTNFREPHQFSTAVLRKDFMQRITQKKNAELMRKVGHKFSSLSNCSLEHSILSRISHSINIL